MPQLTFVTGNPHKAEQVAKILGIPVDHRKVDLPEPQSLDLREIVDAKVRAAYAVIGRPVLVEDAGLRIPALGRLPGPLIKWFEQELGNEGLCRLLDGRDRSAIGEVCFGYYDGTEVRFFEGGIEGAVADHPRGEREFGWDKVFIHAGDTRTRAELPEDEWLARSMRIEPLKELGEFLRSQT